MPTTQTLSPGAVTAKAIRAALKAAFPATKFSVTTDSRGTGAGYINVTWTDGPTSDAVQDVTEAFPCRGVMHSRRFSPEAQAWAAEQLTLHPGRWSTLQDNPGDTYHPTYRCLTGSVL